MEIDNSNPQASLHQQPDTANPSDSITQANHSKKSFIVLAIVLVVALIGSGVYLLGTQKNQPVSQPPLQTTQPTISSQRAGDPLKLIYYEPKEVGQRDNLNRASGYQHTFTVFDISTNTRKVLYHETTIFDQMTHPMTKNQYIEIGSDQGTKKIDLRDQSTPNLAEEYLPDYDSEWNKPSVTFDFVKNGINFTVSYPKTNETKEFTWTSKKSKPWVSGFNPFTKGWSSDEKRVFFTVGSTHYRDPEQILYVLNLDTGEIQEFSRDNTISDVKETYVDGKNDDVYYIAANGVFVQKLDATKATSLELKKLDNSNVARLVFPNKDSSRSIALASNKKIIVKNMDSNDEKVVFESLLDGNLSQINWYGNYIVYFFTERLAKNQSYPVNVVGYVHNLKTNQSTEFVRSKFTDVYRGNGIEFVGWL